MSVVHPVAILSAVCCVTYSLLMFASNATGDHFQIWWKLTVLSCVLLLCFLCACCV